MDRLLEKKKFTLRKVFPYAVAGLIALLIIYNLIFGDSGSKLNVDRQKMTISEVSEGPFQEFIPVTGNVIPIKTVYLDAIEGGRVEKKYLEAGSMVELGDEILLLGNTNMMMDIMFREAELYEQSNNLRNTRLDMERNRLQLKSELIELDYQIQTLARDYARSEELRNENLISQQEFERIKDQYEYYQKRRVLAIESFKQDSIFRKTQIAQLEASLVRMHKNLDLVKTKLENLTIKAPISGQLTALNAEIGESKNRGERLGQVDDLNGFKVRAAIDEHYLSRIEIGLQGEFEFAGYSYRLTTRKIYPEIRDGRFDIDLEFSDTEPEGIRRGQTLHIRLALGDLTRAVLLPRGSFYQKTGGQWIFVLDESQSFAIKHPIRLGRQNPQMFEVLEGLKPGQLVITSNYEVFGDNDKLVFD